jgi:hypothetical protein
MTKFIIKPWTSNEVDVLYSPDGENSIAMIFHKSKSIGYIHGYYPNHPYSKITQKYAKKIKYDINKT